MANPSTPAVASGPPFPPSRQLPFCDVRAGQAFLTPAALQLLQYLFAQLGGAGGVTDSVALSLLGGITTTPGEALIDQLQSNQLAPIPLRDVSPSAITWTPTVAGSTTPGTQTYSIQWGEACYIGPLVLVQFSVIMTALDAATAGNVLISGLPMYSQTSAAVQAGWLSSYANITFGGGGATQLGLDLSAGSSDLELIASGSGIASAPVVAGALAANSLLKGGALYFR